MVKRPWNNYNDKGKGIYSIKEKLKCLKKYIKEWNKEVWGDLNFIKNIII